MGCMQGRPTLCMQSRKFQPYQNESFTSGQQRLICQIFDTMDQEGGGMLDKRVVLETYRKKSKDLKGDLDELVELLESTRVVGHLLDMEAFGDAMEEIKHEKKGQFDTYIGVTSRKVQDSAGGTFHIGDRPKFADDEKPVMAEVFRMLDINEEGMFDTNDIISKFGGSEDDNDTMRNFFKNYRMNGEITIAGFVKACAGYKNRNKKELEYDQFFDKLLEALQDIRTAKNRFYACQEDSKEEAGDTI
mmetsp:Transcript_8764/g.12048  ORF Transcript_8764/g.12048 Transcript_8764/m.12048 type:complete len:246 (+) Transcript_8764:32-769(+)